jgi:hypothetical protein
VFSATCNNSGPPPLGNAIAACPKFLDLELLVSDSRFDPGWTGLAHGIGLTSGSQFSVQITACDPQCQWCSFTGPVRGASPVISQRCLSDTTKVCATDSDCASGSCRFLFPPISDTLVGLSTCSVPFFEPVTGTDTSPVQGVINLATGDATLSVFNLDIDIGVGHGSTGDCDQCIGDPIPNDGVKGGTCTTTNQPCDKNGDSTAGTPAETSFDCAAASDGLPPFPIPAGSPSTVSVEWTMDATRPQCTGSGAFTGNSCWCGICSDGTPCFENSQCSDNVCGVATIGGVNFTAQDNACGSAGCNWDPKTQSGTCNGTTTSCFPSTGSMIAEGFAEVHYVPGGAYYITQIANLICIGSFSGTSGTGIGAMVDSTAGYPGPMLFQARFQVNTR